MFYYDKNKKHISDTLEIFQTLDSYYIKDVLEFVKNYFRNYRNGSIKFTYIIEKNKIYYNLNNFKGIMIYNIQLNTLDIYLKKIK